MPLVGAVRACVASPSRSRMPLQVNPCFFMIACSSVAT